jgi:hypothetical protein
MPIQCTATIVLMAFVLMGMSCISWGQTMNDPHYVASGWVLIIIGAVLYVLGLCCQKRYYS